MMKNLYLEFSQKYKNPNFRVEGSWKTNIYGVLPKKGGLNSLQI